MSKKKRIPDKYQIWIDVRKRYHLSDVHIQMVRELGMNPKKFGKIANEKQEPWKKPLPAFIEDIYLKRFGRDRPADVKSIEEVSRAKEKTTGKGVRTVRPKSKPTFIGNNFLTDIYRSLGVAGCQRSAAKLTVRVHVLVRPCPLNE